MTSCRVHFAGLPCELHLLPWRIFLTVPGGWIPCGTAVALQAHITAGVVGSGSVWRHLNGTQVRGNLCDCADRTWTAMAVELELFWMFRIYGLTDWSPLTGLGWKTWGQTCVAPTEVGISRFYLEVQADESWLQNMRKYLVSLLGSKELESTSRAGVVPPCSWPCRGVHCWCFPVQRVGDISEHGASWGLLHGVERWEIMLRFIPSLIQSTDTDQSLCILQDSIQT